MIRARAFAKINLSLRVLGVRSDGYHELRTVFQSIAVHDTLTFVRARGDFRIECDDPNCPTDRRNLVWSAAEGIWRAAGHRSAPRDIIVRVQKRIPMQAGLGGGSSDAAATLRALTRLWRVKLPSDALRGMAAELGADVPYFLEGGTVLGLERGDLLFPVLEMPRTSVVLVIPPFGVSTKDAFAWWDEAKQEPTEGVENDLQGPVTARHPVIARLIRGLRRAGAFHAALSGSGSAVFGLFDRRAAAERAARAVGGRARRALVTRTITRKECRALAAK